MLDLLEVISKPSNTTTPITFVLGAEDDEMDTIENILVEHGCIYKYAISSVTHKRVTQNNAHDDVYVADVITTGIVLTVESTYPTNCPTLVALNIDHHISPQYSKGQVFTPQPPARFWEVSAIGQVIAMMRMFLDVEVEILPYMQLLAAADHCLLEAYKGLCKGIGREALLSYRAGIIGKAADTSAAVITASIHALSIKLSNKAPTVRSGVRFISMVDCAPDLLAEAAMYSMINVVHNHTINGKQRVDAYLQDSNATLIYINNFTQGVENLHSTGPFTYSGYRKEKTK